MGRGNIERRDGQHLIADVDKISRRRIVGVLELDGDVAWGEGSRVDGPVKGDEKAVDLAVAVGPNGVVIEEAGAGREIVDDGTLIADEDAGAGANVNVRSVDSGPLDDAIGSDCLGIEV